MNPEVYSRIPECGASSLKIHGLNLGFTNALPWETRGRMQRTNVLSTFAPITWPPAINH